ncbi:uncharacterized protein LOC115903051 [Camarhynchus parvulus]|uniref:uncharacterized protein LOC115903051 n=1 Tax=Geospiza parvula TaxID=87175 RepID=UPI0012382EE0|nr:uncharacterized protein LOC115903051 [Camarhynchus parvulus]
MTQLGELAKLLDSMGARGEDGTAEKSIQPPALGGEVRARGRAGQGRGRREGSPADPGALPTRLCPAPVSPRAPRAACSKGCPDSAPRSAQAWAAPGGPAELRAASPGKAGTRPSPSGLLRQGQGCSPRPGQDRDREHSPERDGAEGRGVERETRKQAAPGQQRCGGSRGDEGDPEQPWRDSGDQALPQRAALAAERASRPPDGRGGRSPSRRCPGPPRRAPPPHSKRGPAAPSGGSGGQSSGAAARARRHPPPSRPGLRARRAVPGQMSLQ